MGQKQPPGQVCGMSALPPIADIDRRLGNVRLVPTTDIGALCPGTYVPVEEPSTASGADL